MSLLKRFFKAENSEETVLVAEQEPVVPAPTHWYFLLLRCADGSLYADISPDIEGFISACNSGEKKIAYLAGRTPVFLAFSEEFMSERAAKDRLFSVQAMTREKKERLVSSVGLEHISG